MPTEVDLRNDIIIVVLTTGLGAIAWFVKDMHVDVKSLLLSDSNHVSKEQHNELAKSLREANNALITEVAVLRDRMERSK